jgi:hypothetical protein
MKEEKKEPNFPIAEATDSYLHAIRDIEAAAIIFMPLGKEILKKRWDETTKLLDQIFEDIDSSNDEVRLKAQVQFDQQFSRLDRLRNTKLPHQLEKSLFIGLFSSYDAFIGDLIRGIISKRPQLINKIGKKIDLSEIISATSIDDLKSRALDEHVDDFRRDSYSEQFSSLESFFGVKTLTKFDSYPLFIEASQRRHLFTHCNGDISQQYIDVCKEKGYEHTDEVCKGGRLKIGSEYFHGVCDVLFEVGLKLSHTLWRKVFPDEIEDADKHLSDTIFDLLQNEKWERAIAAGEFAVTQKNHSTKERQKIITVNYCIALKFGGQIEASKRLLEEEDWSDSMPDFRLAKAVLLEEFENASKIMSSVGTEGHLISEHSYHTWPLFREFRGNEFFRDAYAKIYGKAFTDEIRKGAQEAKNNEPKPNQIEAEPNGGDQ